MTTATEILKLIEAVDPLDVAKLDKIDRRTQCFLHGLDQEGTNADRFGKLRVWEMYSDDEYRRYSSSRDALKAIRLDGTYKIMNHSNMAHIKHNTIYDYPGTWEARWVSKKEYEKNYYKEIASPL